MPRVISEPRIDTSRHVSSTRVQTPEAIETRDRGAVSRVHSASVAESQPPRVKSVSGGYPPRREGKQGEA